MRNFVFFAGLFLIGATGCAGVRDVPAGGNGLVGGGGGGGGGGDDAGLVGDDAGKGPGDVTPDVMPDGAAPAMADGGANAGSSTPTVGGTARVTADSLNLRTGAGTTNMILTAMPCGSRVNVVGGPDMGWWNVTYAGMTGWASGKYLVAESAFNAAICAKPDGGGGMAMPDAAMPPAADGGMPGEVSDIFARAKLGVGYSYYWGHGSWRADGQQPGACMGSCGNCTHTGAYGADCSGFVAKCWQVPSPSPITTDLHPYSSYNFFNDTTHWSQLPRTKIQPADALVYNANGAGHIVLFESGADPWGNLWIYEARGCSWGVIHDLRAISTSFITIRREGL